MQIGKYSIGDKVHYTNCYGVYWGERIIIGFELTKWGWYYYISESDSPWCPVEEAHLTLEIPTNIKVNAAAHHAARNR